MSALALLAACEVYGFVGSNVSGESGDPQSTGPADDGDSTGSTGTSSTGVEPGTTSSTGAIDPGVDTTEGLMFDVGPGDGPEVCLAPLPMTCDRDSKDPWHAMGVGCSDTGLTQSSFTGHPAAIHVHEGVLGTHGEYAPREGERMVILSTGRAADVPRTHAELGCEPTLCPSTILDPGGPQLELPPPMNVARVDSMRTCTDDPALLGTGDCSNTLEDEWRAGGGAFDYAELRMSMKVPPEANALVYQFAFFSAEYPVFASQGAPWNDMYVAWLESEAWTGNISFDEQGHPISINGVFLDYLDAESPLCERIPCEAPELDGFAMDGHAGTRWLETVAPVSPGEEIEVIFALFDLTDAALDTVVLLDNVHWGCTDLPPLTHPEG